MIKRISFFLVLVMILAMCGSCIAAPTEVEETVTYADGSYMVVTLKSDVNTYSSIQEVIPDQLSQISPVPEPERTRPHRITVAQDGVKYVVTDGSEEERNTYRTANLNDYKKWQADSTQVAYTMHDNYKYFNIWGSRRVKETHYVDWIETDDGDKLPVWRDSKGNILYNTKFATKYCSYYSADNRLLWTMSVTGMFKRNSIDHYCEVISGDITVWETDSWYVIMENVADKADSASYTVQFGRKNLGVTIAEPSYTITLSRDEQGNFH